MTKEQIKKDYEKKLQEAETPFDRQMLEAEYNHKLKMIEEGVDPLEQMKKNSEFECINCSG